MDHLPALAGQVIVAPQASSDDGMVTLWLDSFLSPATRRGYALDIRAFRIYFPGPLRDVTLRELQGFASTLAHLAPATAARRLSAVKSLIGLAHRLGYLPFDIGVPLRLPAVKDTLAERIVSEWQIQRVLEMERHPRNAALLRLSYKGGLRISELCGLLWRDMIELADGEGQITVFGKGGKTRPVPLPAGIWAQIGKLRHGAGENDPVFRSRNGGALQVSQVHRIVKRAAKRAGLPAAFSEHWFRHAHVSHALDRGAPPHVVMKTVGHASLETTTRYTHVRPGDSSAKYLPD